MPRNLPVLLTGTFYIVIPYIQHADAWLLQLFSGAWWQYIGGALRWLVWLVAIPLVIALDAFLLIMVGQAVASPFLDLLSERLRRRGLRIAGRLDRATSGLLILTSDGALVHRLTHPARKLPKRYRIELDGELAADAVRRCAEGLLLPGEERETRPAELQLDGPGRATLVLREGRTHQVRRMMRALGAEVVGLHRDRIGDLDLPEDLGPGELRPLEPEERALLLSERSL